MNNRKNNTSRHINLFILNSSLQYFASKNIAQNLESDAQNYLFLIKTTARTTPKADDECWTFKGEILHSKSYPLSRFWGRYKRLAANAQYVGDQLPSNPHSITLHVPHIKSKGNNFFINYLRDRFPDSQFRVRLIIDGTTNTTCLPLKFLSRLRQLKYKLIHLIFPELNYYRFQGDITGIDASIVDRIYLFEGFSHEYLPEKVYYLPLGKKSKKSQENNEQILVLGNPVFKNLNLKMLHWVLAIRDGKEIIYKLHPDESPFPLPENCRLASFSEPLEEHLMGNYYPFIVGIASTGLITARQLCGKQTRIVSYGINHLYSAADVRQARRLKQVNNLYEKINIECIQTQDE